jgi:hypothetical protein
VLDVLAPNIVGAISYRRLYWLKGALRESLALSDRACAMVLSFWKNTKLQALRSATTAALGLYPE